MAERLTKKISKTIQNKYSLGSYLYYDFAEIDDTNKLLNKLGRLEDILEKYGIESVEELDNKLQNLIFITSTMNDYSITNWEELDTVLKNFSFTKKQEKDREEIYKNMQQDRDTWKRACELACEREDDCYVYDNIHRAYEFYQQAKKEGENNDTNN